MFENKNLSNNKKLAIIGGGLCGILSAKFAKQAGFEITIYEKSNSSGGVWCGNNRAWPHMHTNVCKYGSGFSDFSWKKNDPMYPSREEMLNFIYDYIKVFNISNLFSFNTEITKINYDKSILKYQVYGIKNCKNEFIAEYDFVIMATGYFNTPNYSNFEKYFIFDESLKSFVSNKKITNIKVVHSSSYKSPNEFKNKSVMIIGHSHSATQLSCEISDTAKVLYNCFRRPYFVFPMFINSIIYNKKIPVDLELFHQKDDIMKIENLLVEKAHENSCENKLKLTNQNSIHENLYIDPNEEEHSLPDISISEHYCQYVEKGKVIPIKSEIKFINENSVILNNGEEYFVDEIVLCTGYKMDLSIMDENILKLLRFDNNNKYNPLTLDYSVYNPNLPTMSFVGMCRGLLYVTYELQARLAVNYFVENIEKKLFEVNFDSKEHTAIGVTNENYNLYTFGLANRLDLTPDLKRIKEIDKELYEAILLGPMLTQQFNLNKKLSEFSEEWKNSSDIIKTLYCDLKNENNRILFE
jgi:dimethylaniline monooxygenase (N-oxide forming)